MKRQIWLAGLLTLLCQFAEANPLTAAELARGEAGAQAQLEALRAGEDTEALCVQLEDWLRTPALTAVERERLLYYGTLRLADLAASARGANLLSRLAGRASRVQVWHTEGRHRTAIPAYDTGAAARHALERWARREARESLRAAVGKRGFAGLAKRGSTPPSELAKFTAAGATLVAQLSKAELAAHRDDLLLAVQTEPGFAPAALAAGMRLGDVELTEIALYRGDGTTAVRELAALRSRFSATEAFRLLEAAATQPALASASLLQMGALMRDSAAARARLFATLGDPQHGGSAAAAIARNADADAVRALGDVALTTSHESRRRRALLALRLVDRADAQAQLGRFVAASDDPALVATVAKWLPQ